MNRYVPKRRFKGFTGQWEESEFGKETDVRDGTHDSPKYVSQGYPLITSKNVGDGKINFEEIQFISEEDYNIINKRSKVEKGDILMGMIGTIGNMAIVKETPEYAIKNVALIKKTKSINVDFIYNLLNSRFIISQIEKKLDGGTQKFLALNKIRELKILLPSHSEQKLIGLFFKNLDEQIDKQGKKAEKLKNLKKAYLSEMFPAEGVQVPKRRFKGFTEPWKQRKLGEVAVVNSGKDYKHLEVGEIPVYGTGGYMISVNKALSYKNDAIGIGRKGTIDNPFILRAPFWTVDTLFFIFPKEMYELYFLYNIFEKINWNSKDESSGIPSLSKKIIEDTIYFFPTIEEQKLIGSFFKKLDDEINLEQKRLEKLKQLKQAYLEEMFV
mgnify:CR=1 FL=1